MKKKIHKKIVCSRASGGKALTSSALAAFILITTFKIMVFGVTATSHAKKKPKLPRVTLKQVTTPVRSLKVAEKHFQEIVMDFKKGRKLLEESPLAKKGDQYEVKILKLRRAKHHPADPGLIMKIRLDLPGKKNVSAIFKPFQTRYRDGLKELAACNLAAFLGIRQPACGERVMTREQGSHALQKIPKRYQKMLNWEDDKVRGFVRLWADRYKPRIGRLAPSRENMLALSKHIRPRGLCNKHQMCRDMSDLLLFDFLVSNNDRQYNVGTILTKPKNLVLYPIDWGDSFTGTADQMKRKVWYRKAFYSLVRFRSTLIETLKSLDRPKVNKLTSDTKGTPLISTFHRERIMEKRNTILKRVEDLESRYGRKIFFHETLKK